MADFRTRLKHNRIMASLKCVRGSGQSNRTCAYYRNPLSVA
jgi:hypothetical protein